MIQVGIVGSSGFVAGELIRCLVHHPAVNINFMHSHSHEGCKIDDIHQDVLCSESLTFSSRINSKVDVLFLCLGHGHSSEFLGNHHFSVNTKIIDLSNDFRLKQNAKIANKNFIYGLVELNKKLIQNTKYVSNPGCFATAIQLGLLPLAKNNNLNTDIHIHAITGSTGAGQSLSDTTHFSWRNNNVSIYKAFNHQHLAEIKESLVSVQKDFNSQINLIPVRGNFTRGIFATIYTQCTIEQTELIEVYRKYYQSAKFTFIRDIPVHLKQVVNTNNCFIHVQKIDEKALITVVIDNLLRGAAGQAIQNMNLMLGLDEHSGLSFKANYF